MSNGTDSFILKETKPAREYKDRLFRMIFKEKERFLELYNAMNGTHYDNPDDLTVTTLENAIYMGMRNDVSYLLYDQLTLYEHQASINPNMPLRNLLYVSDIYSSLTRNENLYGSRLIPLPAPQFVVFYNGVDHAEEQSILRLSDSFSSDHGIPNLELKVRVFNINPGYNQKLLSNCQTLRDYMIYVDKVRTYAKELEFAAAVERAIQECISDGVLAEFLSRNRAEVKKMSIYEYDEEKHIRMERAAAMEDGIKKGRTFQIVQAALKKYSKGLPVKETADMLETEPELVQRIYDLKKTSPDLSLESICEQLLK